MERRLRVVLRAQGHRRLTDSIEALRRDPAQLDALLDRITINVSQLWRNPEQWTLLESKILPELSRDRERAAGLERRLLLRRRGIHARGDLPRGRACARA